MGGSHPLHPSLVCVSTSAIPQERTVLLECLRVGTRERNNLGSCLMQNLQSSVLSSSKALGLRVSVKEKERLLGCRVALRLIKDARAKANFGERGLKFPSLRGMFGPQWSG